jgi:hypothetical protein
MGRREKGKESICDAQNVATIKNIGKNDRNSSKNLYINKADIK